MEVQIYSAMQQFHGAGEEEIEVASQRCRYRARIGEETIELRGPGVQESALLADIINGLSFESDEDLAILAVILFENGLWPEE